MTRKPIRFGLIGTGRIGQVHALNITASPNAELACVCDPSIEGAHALAARHGGKVTNSADEVLSSDDVDAVLIASPTSTHIDLIAAAVDAGIPVLCEKPIDLDITRVDGLYPKVLKSGIPVALGFNRRFDAGFTEVRARVATGEIGRLEQLTITSRDPSPPPANYIAGSGGIFRDMSIHDFDMARFFVPDIVEVHAVATNTFDSGSAEHGDYDTAVTVLRAASGAIITIINSRHSAYGYDQRLEAFGSKGMLQVGNMGTSLISKFTSSAVEARAPYQPFFIERYAQAYATEVEEFIKLVRGEPTTISSYADGRAALILADAAERSVKENRAIVVDA